MGKFQTYPFILRQCQIVTDHTTQKELVIHKIYRRRYSTPLENPDDTQKHSDNKRGDNNWERKIFLLQISLKGIRLQILQDPMNSVL
jgi:hypothetical protein